MTDDQIAALAPDNIRNLPVYRPGKPVEELERELGITGATKLASNENPMGASPAAVEAAREAVTQVHRYPDGGAFGLRRAVAQHLSVDDTWLLFGSGSNEVVHLAIRALCRPGIDEVVSHACAFISYKLATMAHGAKFVEVAVDDDLRCDVDAMLGAITDNTKIVFVAHANNPTGAHLSPDELARLIAEVPEHVLLVIDEAYYEYSISAAADYRSSIESLGKRTMLLTLRTFSKIYGLAGLRVGYAIADPRILDLLNRVRRPFNVNLVAQQAAIAALTDDAHVRRSAAAAEDGIATVRAGAEKLGLRPYPSAANFVLIDVGRPSGPVYEALLPRGVIVRPMGAWGLPNCLRVTVGNAAENDKAIAALTAVLAEDAG